VICKEGEELWQTRFGEISVDEQAGVEARGTAPRTANSVMIIGTERRRD
jgi:hypothetical protein